MGLALMYSAARRLLSSRARAARRGRRHFPTPRRGPGSRRPRRSAGAWTSSSSAEIPPRCSQSRLALCYAPER
jgi:hypothetical protein